MAERNKTIIDQNNRRVVSIQTTLQTVYRFRETLKTIRTTISTIRSERKKLEKLCTPASCEVTEAELIEA